jgi:hypothetical protein
MRTSGVLLAVLLVNFARPSYAAYPQPSVPNGARFHSPDGRYSVELQEIDRLSRYVIEDTKTRTVDRSIIMPSLLLYLHWAPNSRSIVTVEHVPHGSCGRVIYLKDDKWADVEVRPPGPELKDSAVIELKITPAYAHYRFAVRYIQPNGTAIRYAFCDLDVNFKDGSLFNIHWSSTSEAEWAASLERRPSYIPPMEQKTHGSER